MLFVGFANIFFLNLLFRYALREGAAATAVDIEDIVDNSIKSGSKPVTRIIPHTVQRRAEAGCRDKDGGS